MFGTGTESPKLKGEKRVTAPEEHSPLCPGTEHSLCGTNPAFTQDLQEFSQRWVYPDLAPSGQGAG